MNTITNRQMVFILFLTLTSITIVTIPKDMAEAAGVGNWIPLMLMAVLFGVLVTVIVRLQKAFPGKALYDYSRELVGKAGCYVISMFYVLYFLTVNVYLANSMAGMLKANFLFETPHWAFIAVGIPVFGYLAYHGPATVARIFELYGVIFLIGMLVVHVNMLIQGDLVNIRPLVVPSEIGRALGAMDKTIIAFLGIEVLTVMPFAKGRKKAPRVAFLTLIAVGMIYVMVVETSIMMVGLHEIKYYEYPLLAAIRQVELENIEFLRRVDILYLTIGLMGIFAGISVVYLALVEYAVKLLPRASRLAIVIAAGILVFILGLLGFGIPDFDEMIVNVITYSGLAAAGLIPIILLIVAKGKKRA